MFKKFKKHELILILILAPLLLFIFLVTTRHMTQVEATLFAGFMQTAAIIFVGLFTYFSDKDKDK